MENFDLKAPLPAARVSTVRPVGNVSVQVASPTPTEQTHQEQYLVFTLLEHEFAFPAQHIQGVERLADVTPVPNVASWVRGVINLRGSIASVVDLRTFFGMEQLPYNPRTRLLSIQCNDMVICLVVDSVSEMVLISDAVITRNMNTPMSVSRQSPIPSWAASYASGSAELGKRTIVLLDAARLLFSDKMQHYES